MSESQQQKVQRKKSKRLKVKRIKSQIQKVISKNIDLTKTKHNEVIVSIAEI